ncbi:hypothetical protein [Serratia rubidaea]|nr:hypothetical protein [Serratia rubidaea]
MLRKAMPDIDDIIFIAGMGEYMLLINAKNNSAFSRSVSLREA